MCSEEEKHEREKLVMWETAKTRNNDRDLVEVWWEFCASPRDENDNDNDKHKTNIFP